MSFKPKPVILESKKDTKKKIAESEQHKDDLDLERVRKTAELAQIKLSPEQEKQNADNSKIFELFNMLDQVDIDTELVALQNMTPDNLREDIAVDCSHLVSKTHDKTFPYLNNDNFFVVPAVLDAEE